MRSRGDDQVAVEAVAKAKAIEMQKRKAAGSPPAIQAGTTSSLNRLTAVGIWIVAIASLIGVFYTN